MNSFKTHLENNYKTLSLLSIALIFSVVALIIRLKLNSSFFFLFLIWNICLAIIPFGITMYLRTFQNFNKLKLSFWFLVWLAFLPNAPYIVTDLVHVRSGSSALLWLDILVILSFALSGLFLFYLSILDMQKLISKSFKRVPVKTLTILIIFLSAFGVYLGRFLRHNSWEIITAPQHLLIDIFNILIAPFQHYEAWLFTLGFGSFLAVGFWMFKMLRHSGD